jgi:heme A synthase
MDILLFSERSIWTMVHGIVLGGGALMALAAALFGLRTMRAATAAEVVRVQARHLAWLLVLTAVLLWLTLLVGTYVTFPPYRATPPDGLTDLSAYPRALIRSTPGAEWLHGFAMETKEHVPWIAAMLATAVAAVSLRYRSLVLSDRRLNDMASVLVAVCIVLVTYASILGVFINKVAPLE